MRPLADLESLGRLDAAIGESAHFNAESYRLRHLITRYLVERHGFTAYAMESGFVEGRQVDAWLRQPVHDEAFEVAERALSLAIALDAYRRDMTVNIRDLAQADTVDRCRSTCTRRRGPCRTVQSRHTAFWRVPLPHQRIGRLRRLMHLPHVTPAQPDPDAIDAAPSEVASAFAAG